MTPHTPGHRPPRSRRAAHLGGQDGFVLVVVLALLSIGLALGAVAVAESLDSRTATTQDQRTRRAQQATDAGIQSQLYQQSEQNIDTTLSLNSGPLNLSTLLICKVPALNVATGQLTGGLADAAVNSAGVCPGNANPPTSTMPVQALGNHAYDQSEFIPGAASTGGGTLYPKIVSLGWDDNGGSGTAVYSRQLAVLAPIAPLRTLEAQGNLTISGVSVLGVNALSTVNGNISAGKDLTTPALLTVANLQNTSGASTGLLGSVTYGGTYHGFLTVPAPVQTTQPVIRQPISVASTKASCPDAANTCSGITVTGGGGGYSATTNTFSLTSGTATFAAGDYVLCSFDAEGGTVNVSPTSSAPVRIFIDSPTSARCNSTTTSAALYQYNDKADVNRGNLIAKNGFVNGLVGASGIAAASGLQLYVVGDQNTTNPYDNATTVTLGAQSVSCGLLCLNPVTQAYILYAPTSSVTMTTGPCVAGICTGGVFEGALVGDNVTAQATTFTENLAIGNYPLYNGVSVYHPLQFVQCSSQPFKTVSGVTTKYTRLQADPAIDTNGC